MVENDLVMMEKMKDIFRQTVENSDLRWSGDINNIDYFGILCKAAASNKIHKFFGSNLCSVNTLFNNEDSVLFIFSIISSSDSSTKHTVDKIMDVTKFMEKCFVTLDFIHSYEVKDEKFVYLSFVKKIQSKGN